MVSSSVLKLSSRTNRGNLREVETIYDVESLNKARQRGDFCIIKKKELNPELSLSALLLRHRENGKYEVVPERRFMQQHRGMTIYSEEEWELVQTIEGYARPFNHESNWSAYIVPADAKVGEIFFIKNLIEDLVASAFWGSVCAAETAEASWDGEKLVIDSYSHVRMLVG